MERELVLTEAHKEDAAVIRLEDPVTDGDHFRGDPAAPITLLEYGEFECPDCGRAYHVIKRVVEELEGEVRFAFRHLARDDVHPFSERSAQAAEAAGAQGHFWAMHDFLFERQHQLELADLTRHAAELGLDVDAFQRDLSERVHLPKVRSHTRSALETGVTHTPTLFIDGVEYTGPITVDALTAALRSPAKIG